MRLVIEGLNSRDRPGYFLSRSQDACVIVERFASPYLKAMFDTYHAQIMEGDILARLSANIASIGHIQISGVPGRSEPDSGELNHREILLGIDDETFLVRALAAGAQGYLLKDCAEADLLLAVKAVANKKLFFSPTITQTLLEDYMRQMQNEGLEDSYDLLTDREKEVLQLLAEGKSNKEAAGLLNVSLYTVETHRSRLMQKLNLHSTADIVLYAVRKRIIQ